MTLLGRAHLLPSSEPLGHREIVPDGGHFFGDGPIVLLRQSAHVVQILIRLADGRQEAAEEYFVSYGIVNSGRTSQRT